MEELAAPGQERPGRPSKLDELGLDSLALTEVLLDVEDHLGFELPEELLERLEDARESFVTLQDVFDTFEL